MEKQVGPGQAVPVKRLIRLIRSIGMCQWRVRSLTKENGFVVCVWVGGEGCRATETGGRLLWRAQVRGEVLR